MATTVTWICKNCEGEPVFGHRDFVTHCKTVHGLKSGDQITLIPRMYLDGSRFAERQYDGECKGLQFMKIERDNRGSR